MTRGISQDSYDRVIGAWRVRRRPAWGQRKVGNTLMWDDPAPEWAARVGALFVDALPVDEQPGDADTLALLLRWCDTGAADERADRVIQLTKLWPLCHRRSMLRAFLGDVESEPDGFVPEPELSGRNGADVNESTGWAIRRWGLPVQVMKWNTVHGMTHRTAMWVVIARDQIALMHSVADHVALAWIWQHQDELQSAWELSDHNKKTLRAFIQETLPGLRELVFHAAKCGVPEKLGVQHEPRGDANRTFEVA